MTESLFADAIKNVSYTNGVLRVTLARQNARNDYEESGTLLLPISQAGQFANGLTTALKQLEEKMRETREQRDETPANETPAEETPEVGADLNFDK